MPGHEVQAGHASAPDGHRHASHDDYYDEHQDPRCR